MPRPQPSMLVGVHWRPLVEDDVAWHYTRVLYAYLHRNGEILYIGKADGATSTVRTRIAATDKLAFWAALRRQRGIDGAEVHVGGPSLDAEARLTRELLADVESLLIAAIRPWGNIQCRSSRICRPGLVVRCHGRAWPAARTIRDRV